MLSDPRALRERIRQVKAGGHRDTPLRRAYNRKLRAHRTLRGGDLEGLSIAWEGSLTFKMGRLGPTKTTNYRLYNCGLFERYSTRETNKVSESMVVLFAVSQPCVVCFESSCHVIEHEHRVIRLRDQMWYMNKIKLRVKWVQLLKF